ncbi:hypothetical protein BZL30_2498 [Mycobacterium kansasii]|uniref:Uncharacterized protein n=1 Tax=Mycobacterium kansasii TaxID=1768 RepID=A0A1V3XIR5_MYCKA|nr:hypothetical protein BZL30_2498 [Mycobacterium kansasii]
MGPVLSSRPAMAGAGCARIRNGNLLGARQMGFPRNRVRRCRQRRQHIGQSVGRCLRRARILGRRDPQIDQEADQDS